MNYTIKSRYAKNTIISVDAKSLKMAIEKVVYSGVDLRYANLYNADLRNANLRYANLRYADLYIADLRYANLRYADLYNADLYNADLRNANLRNANLRNANLRYADLYNADLRNADLNLGIPVVPNIHQAVYQKLFPTVNGDGTPKILEMNNWHSCETTHCWAGHIVVEAGAAGACLEGQIGTGAAAALILQVSDPTLSKIPNWNDTNEHAWADIQRLAGVTVES